MTRRTQWLVRYLLAYLGLEEVALVVVALVVHDHVLVGVFLPVPVVMLLLQSLPGVGVGVYVSERGCVETDGGPHQQQGDLPFVALAQGRLLLQVSLHVYVRQQIVALR